MVRSKWGKIRFWEDKWIPGLPNFMLTTSKSACDETVWVQDFIDMDRKSSKKERLLQVKEEVEAILTIPISMFQREDLLMWHHTSNGEYSVKSGYHIAVQALSKCRLISCLVYMRRIIYAVRARGEAVGSEYGCNLAQTSWEKFTKSLLVSDFKPLGDQIRSPQNVFMK
ncbi:hypothetical protein RHSIM_Rhsim09G0131500 [Rhododendron simsii]|uniref:Uncharacterized protein n=1 Tax=Rhododendron simsii TaxID=118357 RepID=A0A834GFB4_RHOSS|nr:hypothetical protein RHSIM_Rhsim09G0131500 [Rhododendron simsii]